MQAPYLHYSTGTQATNTVKPGNCAEAALCSRVEPGIGLVSVGLPSVVYLLRKAVSKISSTADSEPDSGGIGTLLSGGRVLDKKRG